MNTDDIDKPTRNESRVGAVEPIIADDIDKQLDKILTDHYGTDKTAKQSLHQLIQEAKLEEWGIISETMHSAGITAELYVNRYRNGRVKELKDRINQLKEGKE